jgi:2-polyprenyl-6-methoxyphenol hydroxylase-like FAD-dependent oxidoreductase
MRIAIVGYGTAGQALAALLAHDDHRLDVFERAPVLGPVGAGILLQPTGLWVLWQMGLLGEALKYGAPVRRLFGDTATGRPVMDMRYTTLDPRLAGLGMQRGALFQLLKMAWPDADKVRCGHDIVSISEDGRWLTDDTGLRHGPYDLVVIANGSASKLRDIMGRHRLNRPYPWGALWCLLPQGDWPHVSDLRQRYRAARRMMGLLPVGSRPDNPEPQLSFFWSLPVASIESWREHGLSAWHQEASALWPEATPLLTHITDPGILMQASYRDAVLKRWQRAPVVLLGDAAHAMSPQLGQGVNMALMDALALRDALRSGDSTEEALVLYERERQAHAHIYQFWSRWLTPLFQSERDMAAWLRDLTFIPMARLPISRGQMLRVLTGTQKGWFGQLRLSVEFLDALGAAFAEPTLETATSPARRFPLSVGSP